ncbi:MAG: recombinase family protein [Cyanobacteria bacterium P01_F01_bin.3]
MKTNKHLVELAKALKKRDVALMSLKEKIDTSTAMGKFFFRMTASIAELERDIIRERTLAGLAAAGARGRKGGRKTSITEGPQLEAKRLADEGKLSITDICRRVGISRASYYRLLT